MTASMKRRAPRGMALVVVLSVVVLLTVLVAFAIKMSNRDRGEAGKEIRNITAQNVTESALQYARIFFAQRYTQWNTYLALSYPPDKTANPELFPPVPGTGYSCYVYARDDADELPPATANPALDNNLRIFVGAVCTSPNGGPTTELAAPLEYNPLNNTYSSQAAGGTQGINNYSRLQGYR